MKQRPSTYVSSKRHQLRPEDLSLPIPSASVRVERHEESCLCLCSIIINLINLINIIMSSNESLIRRWT